MDTTLDRMISLVPNLDILMQESTYRMMSGTRILLPESPCSLLLRRDQGGGAFLSRMGPTRSRYKRCVVKFVCRQTKGFF